MRGKKRERNSSSLSRTTDYFFHASKFRKSLYWVNLPTCVSKTLPQKSEFAATNKNKSTLKIAKARILIHELAIEDRQLKIFPANATSIKSDTKKTVNFEIPVLVSGSVFALALSLIWINALR